MLIKIQEYIVKYPALRLVLIIALILLVLWVLRLALKRLVYTGLLILLGCFCVIIYNGCSPVDLGKKVGVSRYKSIINNSWYIKMTDKGVKLKLDDGTWVSLSDVVEYYPNGGLGSMLIKVGDTYRRIADRNAINLIKAIGRN